MIAFFVPVYRHRLLIIDCSWGAVLKYR